MLNSVQLNITHRAILDSFDPEEFDQILRGALGVRSDLIAGAGASFDRIVFEVIQHADRTGWIRELLEAVHRARPHRADLAALNQELGITPPDDLPAYDEAADSNEIPRDPAPETILQRHAPLPYIGLWREQLTEIEGQVCRVERSTGPLGTGFLVGPDVVLTAYSVMRSLLTGNDSPYEVSFRFDYRALRDGTNQEGLVIGLHPTDWMIDASPYSNAEGRNDLEGIPPTTDELDYVLVRLARRIGDEPIVPDGGLRGWVRVPEVDPPIQSGDPLFLLQHFNGSPLRLAFNSRAVIGFNANHTRLRYSIESGPGSGGGPCFDATWNLVALHHYRYRKPAVNGFEEYCQGISIAAIRDRVKRQGVAWALGADRLTKGGRMPPDRPRDLKPPTPGRVVKADDPQKGRWGGEPARNGRRVIVELLKTFSRTFLFNAVIESTDGTPLEGPVIFHLHDTFPKNMIHIRRIRDGNRAVLEEVTSYGVFTIGVQVKNGRGEWIGLEYDLAQIEELPQRFKER